jgi:hypothetical protein
MKTFKFNKPLFKKIAQSDDYLERSDLSSALPITRAELLSLKNTGKMKLGIYKITDFRSVIKIPGTILRNIDKRSSDILEHDLFVEAISATELSPIAIDTEFPDDVVYYKIDATTAEYPHYPNDADSRGWIYKRECDLGNSCSNIDFRNYVVPLYAFDLSGDMKAAAITYASCKTTINIRSATTGQNVTYTVLDLTDYDADTNTNGVKYHFCINNSKNLHLEGSTNKVSNLVVNFISRENNTGNAYLYLYASGGVLNDVLIDKVWLDMCFINCNIIVDVVIKKSCNIIYSTNDLGYTAVGQWYEPYICGFTAIKIWNSKIVAFGNAVGGIYNFSEYISEAPTTKVNNLNGGIWAGTFLDYSLVYFAPDAMGTDNTIWSAFYINNSTIKFTELIETISRKLYIDSIGNSRGLEVGHVEVSSNVRPGDVVLSPSNNWLQYNYDLDVNGNNTVLNLDLGYGGAGKVEALNIAYSKTIKIDGSSVVTWGLTRIIDTILTNFRFVVGTGVTLTITATATQDNTYFKFRDGSPSKIYTAGDIVEVELIDGYLYI